MSELKNEGLEVVTRNFKTREGYDVWDKLCSIPKYGFLIGPSGGVAKVPGIGNWIDRDEAQSVVDVAQTELNEARAELAAIKVQEPVARAGAIEYGVPLLMVEPQNWKATPLYSAPVSEAKAHGVVKWPEADEIMQMAFEEGQPADDASGYCFELEEFDLFIERLMSDVARLNAAPVQQVVMPEHEDWSVFIGYLIDKCEGHTVAEENLQGWLSEMLADPHYGALFRREKAETEQPSAISLSIEAAEEEHGGLRAAAKALGVDPGYLSRLKSGEKLNPSDKMLSALGLERVTYYRTRLNAADQGGGQ